MAKTIIALFIAVFILSGCSTKYHNALCTRPDYYDKWQAKCDEHADSYISQSTMDAMMFMAIMSK